MEASSQAVGTHVGVRELRQNLSVYLRRVADGEAFVVTERGVPVAELGPLTESSSKLQRLIARGMVTPPKRPRRGKFAMPPGPIGTRGTDALQIDREDLR